MPTTTISQPSESEVQAVLASVQVLGALIADSLASVEETVSMPQLRVLILAAGAGILNGSAVAEDLGVHPSNATRTADRLVDQGLLNRRTSPVDRRHVELSLTPAGQALVDTVMSHRARRVGQILSRLSPKDRAGLARSLRAFTAAAADLPED